MSENYEITPMPAGWNTVNKKAFLISEVSFSLLCSVILLFSSVGYFSKFNNFYEKLNDFTYQSTKNLFGMIQSRFNIGFSLTFMISIVAIVLTSISTVYYSNIDWEALSFPMPEQEPIDAENPVDVSLPN